MRTKSILSEVRTAWVESMDLDAQGIARLPGKSPEEPGKVVFIQGALPGEFVSYQTTREKARFEKARLNEVLHPAVFRREPKCQWYGVCGGCTMQHLDSRAQLSIKQRALEDNFHHIGKVKPETMLRPLMGPEWQYRYRARFSVVNRSIKKGAVLVGFHEKQKGYVADMLSCDVIPKIISDLLPHLRELVMSLSVRDRVPQIEVAIGELGHEDELSQKADRGLPVLVLRHLLPFTEDDKKKLIEFAKDHDIWLWTQAHGPETAIPFYPKEGKLFYTLPEFGVEVPFRPTDFTQVNHQMNRALVGKAIRLLDPTPDDRILDLFCGIGNFTLPLATQCREVHGIEGSAQLTQRAHQNAEHNQLAHKLSFSQANLFEVDAATIKSWGKADRWLIDPPRDGAHAIAQALVDLAQSENPEDDLYLPSRIVYVSCSPSTLARDAGLLVNHAGYQLRKAGVMNMFPHTSHVESIAVFER